MTEKHINFDLSKTDNVASDVNQLNERNIMCKFCNTVIIWQGTAIKKQHQVSICKMCNCIGRFNQKQSQRVRANEHLLVC